VGTKGAPAVPAGFRARKLSELPQGVASVFLIALSDGGKTAKQGSCNDARRTQNIITHSITTRNGDCGSAIVSADTVVGVHWKGSDSEPNQALAVSRELIEVLSGGQ
jgi:hypothetical protein